MARSILIGVTSDEFASKLGKIHPVEPYEVRALKVVRFCLRSMAAGQSLRVFPLDDPYGPAISDSTIDCLLVSEETSWRAREINRLRLSRGMNALKVHVVSLLKDGEGRKISSTMLWRRSSLKQPRGEEP